MEWLFADTHAPSTLGSFLREFTFGHLDAVATLFLAALFGADAGWSPGWMLRAG